MALNRDPTLAGAEPPHARTQNGTAPQQPIIGDAVTTAFDKSDIQELDPKLIAQITENVIKQLRQVNLQATSSLSQTTAPAVEHQAAAPAGSSRQGDATTAAASHAACEPFTVHTDKSKEPAEFAQRKDAQAQKHTEYSNIESPELRSTTFTSGDGQSPSRPKGPLRLSTMLEETPLERIWGSLFEETGLPTHRLGQLLRGLAVHLIEDYEPKHSLVVTPDKLTRYYRESKLDKEYYPWHIIFDDEDTYISRMYRELGCEHHLVQGSLFERPEIPGLTPLGFSKWMTLMLLAHPAEEFERLRLSVVNMPITNPDDRKERFPKDISQRLFPTLSDVKARNDLRRAIQKHSRNANIGAPDEDSRSADEANVKAGPDLSGSTGSIPRRSTDVRNSQSDNGEAPPIPLERERQPYRASASNPAPLVPPVERVPTVGPAGESIIADDDHAIPPGPIERERKPYYATPGSGRNYDETSIERGPYTQASASDSGPATYVPASGASTSNSTYPAPPRPRQSSVGPPKGEPGLTRTNSNRGTGRTPVGGAPINAGLERGPPPAPSAGTSAGSGPPPEIHQYPPPQNRARNGSFTRRRAPSIGRSAPAADADINASHVTFQTNGYEAHKPVYVERSGGHDGYGAPEDDHPRRTRGWSVGQSMGGTAGMNGVQYGPEAITFGGRRQSVDRRRGSATK